jgi:hypothetical protein
VFYLASLDTSSGVDGQLAVGLAANADDFTPFSTPFANFVIGYYTGTTLDCDSSEDYVCFAFWDSLQGNFFPFNVTIDDPSGESIGHTTDVFYYADSC